MRYQVGDVKKFLSPKHDFFTIKEVIEDPDVQVSYEFDGGVCPDCRKRCKISKDYDFKYVYIMEDKDGYIGYKGETLEGELVRMPDDSFYPDKKKDVEDKLKIKSDYLKDK